MGTAGGDAKGSSGNVAATAAVEGSDETEAPLPESMTVDEHVRLLLQKNPGILVRECRAEVHKRLQQMGVSHPSLRFNV